MIVFNNRTIRIIEIGLCLFIVWGIWISEAYTWILPAGWMSKSTHLEDTSSKGSRTTLRVLFLGDSLTSGLLSSSEMNSFKYLLAERLEADAGSAIGRNLPEIEKIWRAWGWKPDIVVLEIGLNDVSRLGYNALPEIIWARRYGGLLDSFTSYGIQVVVCTMFHAVDENHRDYQKYLRYNQYIRQEAERRDISVADLWQATQDCPECRSSSEISAPYPPIFAGDNFHPSDSGHRLIADVIYQAIVEIEE
jgi:lysophospholipase L1-like esterase